MVDGSSLAVPIVRWLVLGVSLAVAAAYAILTGSLLLGAILYVLLVVLYLFYRLVVAVERIADRS